MDFFHVCYSSTLELAREAIENFELANQEVLLGEQEGSSRAKLLRVSALSVGKFDLG